MNVSPHGALGLGGPLWGPVGGAACRGLVGEACRGAVGDPEEELMVINPIGPIV